jgi:hypothetical protein
MTRLLVSIRDAEEAALALAGGAGLLDAKEPRRGSLGSVAPQVWREILACAQGRVPVSAALGELSDDRRLLSGADLAGARYAKLGLAGCRDLADWPARWAQALQDLPAGVSPVAVVYADYQRCAAPPPESVIEQAPYCQCAAVLFDTWHKDGQDLIGCLDTARLRQLVADARRRGLLVVLGGSLSPATIPAVLPLEPDYIAVRGAACRGTRSDRIDARRVRELAQLVSGSIAHDQLPRPGTPGRGLG